MNSQIKICYDKTKFNQIIELANTMKMNADENTSLSAKKFIDKIMKFSYTKDNNVYIKLYPSETKFLITMLSNNINEITILNDWFEELIKLKEEYKKNKEGDLNA